MLTVTELSKTIADQEVLTDLSFDLRDGDRLAVIGPNGSGKSLLLSMLATLVKPTKGRVHFDGLDMWSNLSTIRPQIGYLAPVPLQALDSIQMTNLTVIEYLKFYAQIYGIKKNIRSGLIQGTLELTDLILVKDQLLVELSIGQQTRAVLAKNVLHDPKLWLLDDPIAQMDSHGQIELLELITELGKMKKTVILSTNHLNLIQEACNRVAILCKEKLVYFGSMPSDLSSSYQQLVKPTMGMGSTS